jgi:hypothetical protein
VSPSESTSPEARTRAASPACEGPPNSARAAGSLTSAQPRPVLRQTLTSPEVALMATVTRSSRPSLS